MRVEEYNSAARLFATDKWVLKIVDGGHLSLLIDFANKSVKRGARGHVSVGVGERSQCMNVK
jgi:hypothetical protein